MRTYSPLCSRIVPLPRPDDDGPLPERTFLGPGQVSPGSGDGVLRFMQIGDLGLECGGMLPSVTLGYETWGALNEDASNAVLVQHALTGSSHVARGDSNEAGWWDDLVGSGKTIDTDRYFVVAANIIGGCYGSTGPSSPGPDGVPWGARFPLLTVRDSVSAEARLSEQLGITHWHAVVGGSLGAARALEWALMFPERIRHCIAIAGAAASTAEQIAFAQTQVAAIRLDPHFQGGNYYGGLHPREGLGLARRIAHITYRSEADLQQRFGRQHQEGEYPLGNMVAAQRGRYQVESYLDHQGAKLADRFDANSYIVLTELLMSHDVGRNRGPLADTVRNGSVHFTVAAVNSDRLYLPEQSADLAGALGGDVEVFPISTPEGHDGFLTRIDQLDPVLRARVFG